MQKIFYQSTQFTAWFKALRDHTAKARIVRRVLQAESGNFGDVKALQGGIYEMRINWGPGYRVYYTRSGNVVYWLLLGGDKSTQQEDIKLAIQLSKNLPQNTPSED